jgi:hypothetical protein
MTYALDQPRPVCAAKIVLPQDNLAGLKVAGYYFMISWRTAGKKVRRFCYVLTFVGLDKLSHWKGLKAEHKSKQGIRSEYKIPS